MTSVTTRQAHLVNQKKSSAGLVSEGLFLAELGKSYTCKKTTAEISTKSKKKHEKTGICSDRAVFLQSLSCKLQKTKKNMAFPTTKRTCIKLGPQETNCTFWPLNCKALRAHLRCWGKLGDFHGGSPISRIGFSSSPGFWRMIISMSWMPLVWRSSTSFFPTTSKKCGPFPVSFRLLTKGSTTLQFPRYCSSWHSSNRSWPETWPVQEGEIPPGVWSLRWHPGLDFCGLIKFPGCQPRCGQEKQDMYHVCSCCW